MIFKLTFEDKTEFATAKNQLHLLQSYDDEFEDFHEIINLEEISDEEAKKQMIRNTEFDENDPNDMEVIPLYDLAGKEDFVLIASTEFE